MWASEGNRNISKIFICTWKNNIYCDTLYFEQMWLFVIWQLYYLILLKYDFGNKQIYYILKK